MWCWSECPLRRESDSASDVSVSNVMEQCVLCEDWYHERPCLADSIYVGDPPYVLVCRECMRSHASLQPYAQLGVTAARNAARQLPYRDIMVHGAAAGLPLLKSKAAVAADGEGAADERPLFDSDDSDDDSRPPPDGSVALSEPLVREVERHGRVRIGSAVRSLLKRRKLDVVARDQCLVAYLDAEAKAAASDPALQRPRITARLRELRRNGRANVFCNWRRMLCRCAECLPRYTRDNAGVLLTRVAVPKDEVATGHLSDSE